jgi:hypothetical protein
VSAFAQWLLDHLEGAVALAGGAAGVLALVGRRIRAALRARRDGERAKLLTAIESVTRQIDEAETRHDERHRRVTARLEDLGRDVKRVDARTHRLVASVSHIKGRLGLPNGDHLAEHPSE